MADFSDEVSMFRDFKEIILIKQKRRAFLFVVNR